MGNGDGIVKFAGSLAHKHQGCDVNADPDCIIRADVTSLNRNIIIRGGGGCESAEKPKCGHFMIAHTDRGSVCGVEFTNMGQHTTEGRYPLHIHLPGDAPEILVRDNALQHNVIKENIGVLPKNVNWGCSSTHDNTFTCADR